MGLSRLIFMTLMCVALQNSLTECRHGGGLSLSKNASVVRDKSFDPLTSLNRHDHIPVLIFILYGAPIFFSLLKD